MSREASISQEKIARDDDKLEARQTTLLLIITLPFRTLLFVDDGNRRQSRDEVHFLISKGCSTTPPSQPQHDHRQPPRFR